MLRRGWCARRFAGTIPEQFTSMDPAVVLGLNSKATRKEARKAYYKLAMKYHPDNAETGDSQVMNLVNAAYSRYNSADYAEEREDFETVRTAGMSTREAEARTTGGYEKKSADEERKIWREREKARQEAKERLNNRKKARTRNRSRFRSLGNEWRTTMGPTVERCFQRTDGKWIYFIKGVVYVSDYHTPAFNLNYRLYRSGFSQEEFSKLGLIRLGSNEELARQIVEGQEERLYVERSIPLRHDAETNGVDQSSDVPQHIAAKVSHFTRITWRDRYFVEAAIVAFIVLYTFCSFAEYFRDVATYGRAHVYNKAGFVLTQRRQKRDDDLNDEIKALEARILGAEE
eukprot:TRINITY_DN7790_c0_g1_i1.p2 TRINITY_DN7790_c0_g1~~TRINITY_DN7790_c0_g1_i1.p2  ORF type:complete len:344 (+),score=55.14 TRINITY_DN7790_c0_g1_i1:70-1101(+)